eukprot:11252622-Alexandrium_andersonii.AAC.1
MGGTWAAASACRGSPELGQVSWLGRRRSSRHCGPGGSTGQQGTLDECLEQAVDDELPGV